MKKLQCIIIGLFLLSSCDQSVNITSDSEKKQEKTFPQTEEISEDFYKIIKETKNVNPAFGINKCNIDIELKEKILADKLELVAIKLRETRKTFDKLWISFYLPGMKVDAGAWAIANFTPNLKVEILGTTLDEEKKQKENLDKIDGKIIGTFFEQQYTLATYTVYEKDNKTFIKMVFPDGSSSVDEMRKKTFSKGTRLEYKNGISNGEYFILTKNSVLDFYNAENKKFTTAGKTK